jgi:hypothetical protein
VDQKAELRANEGTFACMHTPVVGRRSDGPRNQIVLRDYEQGGFRKGKKVIFGVSGSEAARIA